MPHTSRRRPPMLVAALVMTAVLIGVVTAAAPAANAAASAQSTSAQSKPVWMPVHTAFGVDCAGKSPGCHAKRSFYSVDIVPAGQFAPHTPISKATVYAMGGGTLHVGNAHGTTCASTPKGSFGTWVWIDHGHGVKSRYGHLSKILVKDGTHVAAGTPIGVVGTTGKAKNCSVSYLDFEIIHGKLSNDNAYRFNTLQACTTHGTQQTWPRQAATRKKPGSHTHVHFSIWNHVRHGTQFPAGSGSCV